MWETQATTTGFDAKQFTSSQIGEREGSRSGGLGNLALDGLAGAATNLLGISIVGMAMDKVPACRDSIRTYVQNLEDHLNTIDATASADEAYKGEEVKAAVKAYVEKVKEYCINLTSQLNAFSDKLQSALNAWETGTQNIADTVSGSAGSYATGAKYTETL